MKKFLLIITASVSVIMLFVFREEIVLRLNQLEPVYAITSKIMGVQPADTEVEGLGDNYYAYRTLTPEEQLVYNQMADCLLHLKDEVTISTKEEAVVDKIFQCLMSDHPEIFWSSAYEITMYNFSGVDSEYVFRPSYAMSKEEIQAKQEQIALVAEECLQGVSSNMDEYSIAKYLYEYLIIHTDYNKNADNNQNICSVFLNQESVCMGYSKAYQYLLQKCGIESAIISGKSENAAHAWNLVKLDGSYCYIDVTWGDLDFSGEQERHLQYADYSFFGITTEDLLKTHAIKNVFEVPECTSEQNNYYVREGLYLQKFEKETVMSMLQAHQNKPLFLTIRCRDSAVYKQLFEYLIRDSAICDFMNCDTVNYVENEIYHTLSIFR